MTRLDQLLNILADLVRPGTTTMQLNDAAEAFCHLGKVEAAFKGYTPSGRNRKEGYPASICVSIDNEVIHGIPSDRKIEEGQVVKIDMGLLEDGQYDDGAITVLVGDCSASARLLVKATKEALEAGVAQAKPGNTTHDIAKAIEAVAKKYGVYVVHGYGGHGIGEKLHMEPHIPNEIDGSMAVTLVAGQRLAIEPMFATNNGYTYVADDGWTVKTRSGLAAHFEKTVTV